MHFLFFVHTEGMKREICTEYTRYLQAFTLTEEAFFRQRREMGEGAPLLSVVIEGVGWRGLKEALGAQSTLRFEVLTDRPLGLPHERVLAGTSPHERALASKGLGVAFLPFGALPRREWVYHMGRGLLEGGDLLYTDEDTPEGELIFKPGYGDYSLLCQNILGRSAVMEKTLYARCGGWRNRSWEGWYDFLLRGGELSHKPMHIPLVLLTVPKQEPGEGVWPVEAAMRRRGLFGLAGKGEVPGTVLPRFFLEGQPAVTLLLRARGEIQPLKTLLEWVERRSVYPNFHWALSCPPLRDGSMKAYLKALEQNGAAEVYIEEGTVPACLNRRAAEAKGAYLLCMEEGCLPLTANFMGRLLEWAALPRVGMVGSMLSLEDGRTLLPGTLPLFPYLAVEKGQGRLWTQVPRQVSCLPLGGTMVKRETFLRAGGLEEGPERGWMEALSLKLGRQGYACVYCPQSRFSAQPKRGGKPKNQGFWDIFGPLLWEGDPLFNPNLGYEDPCLRPALPPLPPGESL